VAPEKTLKEQAALRIETFTQSHTLYDEAMKAFNKMIRDDSKPGSLGDSIYPMRVAKVSQDLTEGTLAYCNAAKELAGDYSKFCKDPRFVKDYQVRIDYIEIIQEELTTAISALKEKLTNIPFYEEGLKNGETQINRLLEKLSTTKDIMQLAIQKEATYQRANSSVVTASIETIATDSTPKHKKPKTP